MRNKTEALANELWDKIYKVAQTLLKEENIEEKELTKIMKNKEK